MLTKEPLVSPDSEYFLFMPSAVASQVYLYPVCIGHFRYQAGYSLSRNTLGCEHMLAVKHCNLLLKGHLLDNGVNLFLILHQRVIVPLDVT